MITLDDYIVGGSIEKIRKKLRKYGIEISIKVEEDITFVYEDLQDGDIERIREGEIVYVKVETPSSQREFYISKEEMFELYSKLSSLLSKKNLSTIDLENFFEEYESKYKS